MKYWTLPYTWSREYFKGLTTAFFVLSVWAVFSLYIAASLGWLAYIFVLLYLIFGLTTLVVIH